ncbi:hypothetical protein ACJRO7_012548 [Eucalyptus globulus]|uniref:Uncharacterized protein n=1 Tax=Eucalyptus globulus TaxID=34317 RepID=A0ABD3LPH5_EUCGL
MLATRRPRPRGAAVGDFNRQIRSSFRIRPHGASSLQNLIRLLQRWWRERLQGLKNRSMAVGQSNKRNGLDGDGIPSAKSPHLPGRFHIPARDFIVRISPPPPMLFLSGLVAGLLAILLCAQDESWS